MRGRGVAGARRSPLVHISYLHEAAWALLLARIWRFFTFDEPGDPVSAYGVLAIILATLAVWEARARLRHFERWPSPLLVLPFVIVLVGVASLVGRWYGFIHEPLTSALTIVAALVLTRAKPAAHRV